MRERSYSGTKHDATLTERDLEELQKGRPVYLVMGEWGDGTPAFIRISPPQPNPIKQEKE